MRTLEASPQLAPRDDAAALTLWLAQNGINARTRQGQTTAADVAWRSRHTLGAFSRYEREKLADLPALLLRLQGLTWAQIGRELGVHRSTAQRRVYRLIRESVPW